MIITLFNKSDYDLKSVQADVKSLEGLNIKVAPVPVTVSPGDEARIQIATECLRPFLDCPSLEVTFNVSGSLYRYTVPVPTSVLSFTQ